MLGSPPASMTPRRRPRDELAVSAAENNAITNGDAIARLTAESPSQNAPLVRCSFRLRATMR